MKPITLLALCAAGMASMVAVSHAAALDDTKAFALMKQAGCAACHSPDKKLLGPSYKDVAQKRKGSPGAAAMLVKKIREGGKGQYGDKVAMPPSPVAKISDVDLTALVDWILSK